MQYTQALVKKARWMRHARREARDHVSGRGVLTWDDGSQSQRTVVEVSNLSEHGMQLASTEPLSVGQRAYITGDEFRCVGTVRHCEAAGGRFCVGIEFSHEPNVKNAMD